MIVIATRRAQLLARLQMEFVAGVSHELRTPLAVIASAADNIADGIVEDKSKIARYGEVIRSHAKQLNHLVEEILLFAASQQGHHRFNFVLTNPSELVETALARSSELIRAAGFTVDSEVQPNLGGVRVDPGACAHCLQNLIVNAIKYGGEDRWIGVRACAVTETHGPEIQIAVEDHGPGIPAFEQQRIFDPFYRGHAATSAQIHGTGLGLALARRIAEGMGGKLSVTSELGKGSTFVLHLPLANPAVASVEEEPAPVLPSVGVDR